MAKAQAVLGAARGGLILYLNPIYLAVLAWLVLGEPLQVHHYLGSALVPPGIFLVNSAGKGLSLYSIYRHKKAKTFPSIEESP